MNLEPRDRPYSPLETLVDAEVGVARRCFSLPIDGDDPRVFMSIAESALGGFGCGVDVSEDRARAAAIGEVAERYSAHFYDRDTLTTASWNELDEPALDPETFALHSSPQLTAFATSLDDTPRPFDRGTRTSWVRGTDLSSGASVLVPAPFVYLPYRYPQDEPFFTDCTSTGLALAANRESAALSALSEVAERDAVAIVWLAGLAVPRVEFDPDDELGRFVRSRFAAAGFSCVLLDAHLDLPLSVVIAILFDEKGRPSFGSAARSSSLAAARKALLEAAQARISWKRDSLIEPRRRFASDFSDVREFSDHPVVYADPARHDDLTFLWSSRQTVHWREIPDRATGRADRDLEVLFEGLEDLGHRAVAVEVTTPDLASLGLRVVRALAPGLQPLNGAHCRPALGGLRLRELPMRLGLATAPLADDDLNRLVHPFA